MIVTSSGGYIKPYKIIVSFFRVIESKLSYITSQSDQDKNGKINVKKTANSHKFSS